MAEVKTSALPVDTTPLITDRVVIISDPSTTPVSSSTLLSKIKTLFGVDTLQTSVDGWIPATGTWTYASATTITVPAGAAAIYSVGDKWKLTANGVFLQGYVTVVADTLLTTVGNALTNYAFTNNYYSKAASPLGFPQYFNYAPTGPTNTTLTGRFSINGRTVTVDIKGVLTGAPSFENMPTLPVAVGASTHRLTLLGSYLDAGTAWRYGKITGFVDPNDVIAKLYDGELASGNMTLISATVPITWATNDIWSVRACYEI